MSRDIPEMVTREQVEQLLEPQKTVVLQGLTVSLRTAPGAVEPLRAAVASLLAFPCPAARWWGLTKHFVL